MPYKNKPTHEHTSTRAHEHTHARTQTQTQTQTHTCARPLACVATVLEPKCPPTQGGIANLGSASGAQNLLSPAFYCTQV